MKKFVIFILSSLTLISTGVLAGGLNYTISVTNSTPFNIYFLETQKYYAWIDSSTGEPTSYRLIPPGGNFTGTYIIQDRGVHLSYVNFGICNFNSSWGTGPNGYDSNYCDWGSFQQRVNLDGVNAKMYLPNPPHVVIQYTTQLDAINITSVNEPGPSIK